MNISGGSCLSRVTLSDLESNQYTQYAPGKWEFQVSRDRKSHLSEVFSVEFSKEGPD